MSLHQYSPFVTDELKYAKMRIAPYVRSDGITFVDKHHFIDGSPIMSWKCTRDTCGFTTDKTCWDDDDADRTAAHAEATNGFYGPNGNGYNYWCPKCGYRMIPTDNPYNALDAFFGSNQ